MGYARSKLTTQVWTGTGYRAAAHAAWTVQHIQHVQPMQHVPHSFWRHCDVPRTRAWPLYPECPPAPIHRYHVSCYAPSRVQKILQELRDRIRSFLGGDPEAIEQFLNSCSYLAGEVRQLPRVPYTVQLYVGVIARIVRCVAQSARYQELGARRLFKGTQRSVAHLAMPPRGKHPGLLCTPLSAP